MPYPIVCVSVDNIDSRLVGPATSLLHWPKISSFHFMMCTNLTMAFDGLSVAPSFPCSKTPFSTTKMSTEDTASHNATESSVASVSGAASGSNVSSESSSTVSAELKGTVGATEGIDYR